MQDIDNSLLTKTIKYITSKLTVDNERLKAVFTFLPPTNSSNEITACAFEKILYQYFKIILSIQQLTHLKNGRTIQFSDNSVIGLPARTVTAVLRPNNCLLKIEGQKAVDGRDGYSEIFFPWKKEAGQVDKQGNIDLKRTNALAGINQGELLATIFLKTDGLPGITFEGKKIKPRKGQGTKVKWDNTKIEKVDVPSEESAFQLIANISGLITATFLKRDNPKSLSTLTIQESVTINGDVNYGIGNQGNIDGVGNNCSFSLDIKGNVRGAFSLQSNGFIHVHGTIEGKCITARKITAELITGGCITIGTETIRTKSIVNATARASQITIEHNASGSTLIADSVILASNANFVGMTVETNNLESKENNFSGRNTITFSPQLFKKLKQINKEINTTEKLAYQAGIPNKDIATAMLTDIARIESIVKQKKSSLQKISALIVDIKLPVLNAIHTAGKIIDNKMVKHCYTLQAVLGEAGYDESLLRKVDTLTNHIKRYNNTANELALILDGHQIKKDLAATITTKIENSLFISLKSPKMIGQNSRLHVKCQEIEATFAKEDFKGNRIEIRYIAPPEDQDISKGKIVLTGKL